MVFITWTLVFKLQGLPHSCNHLFYLRLCSGKESPYSFLSCHKYWEKERWVCGCVLVYLLRCISIYTIREVVDLTVHPQASIVGLIWFQTLQQWEVVDLMVHPHASILSFVHNHQFNLKKETLKWYYKWLGSFLFLGKGDMH